MSVQIEPWGEGDRWLLERLLGNPAMMEHLGGPESAEKIAGRQARYELPDSRQFKIVDDGTGEDVGWVGYWDRSWRAQDVLEAGWSVLPEQHGQGIAGQATVQLLDRAAADSSRTYLHAFPSVDNAASNAICRKAGFVLLEALDFEYPRGHMMRCNDWRADLAARREH